MRTPQVPIGSGFDAATTAAQVIEGIDLTGKTVIVTGGYSGIGVETVRAFLMPSTNPRSDRYGGPIAQRMNFVMELVEALTQALGRDRVGIRLSPFPHGLHGNVYDEVLTSLHDQEIACIHLKLTDQLSARVLKSSPSTKALRRAYPASLSRAASKTFSLRWN
jgi:NADH:flavin oxidoreductase / NADH oxidase family